MSQYKINYVVLNISKKIDNLSIEGIITHQNFFTGIQLGTITLTTHFTTRVNFNTTYNYLMKVSP